MLLPVRCYTCGKILAHLTEACEKYSGDTWAQFFEDHNILRYCCRRIIMSHVPDLNHASSYTLPPSVVCLPPDETVTRLFIAR